MRKLASRSLRLSVADWHTSFNVHIQQHRRVVRDNKLVIRLASFALMVCFCVATYSQSRTFNAEIHLPGRFPEREIADRVERYVNEKLVSGKWSRELAEANRPAVARMMTSGALGLTARGTTVITVQGGSSRVRSFIPSLDGSPSLFLTERFDGLTTVRRIDGSAAPANKMPAIFGGDFRETLARPTDLFVFASYLPASSRLVQSKISEDNRTEQTYDVLASKNQKCRMKLRWYGKPPRKLEYAECYFDRNGTWFLDSTYKISGWTTLNGRLIPKRIFVKRVGAAPNYVPTEKYVLQSVTPDSIPKIEELLTIDQWVTDYRIAIDKPSSYQWSGHLPAREALVPNQKRHALKQVYNASPQLLAIGFGIVLCVAGFRLRRRA